MLNSIVVLVPLAHMIVIVTLTAFAECQWTVSVSKRAFEEMNCNLTHALSAAGRQELAEV